MQWDHTQIKGGVAKSVRHTCNTRARIRLLRRAAKGSYQPLKRTGEEANQDGEEDRRQGIPAVRDFFPHSGSFLLNAAEPTVTRIWT